ncbi:hypothetical protein BG011_010015, partial [Mortierella polycephala]
MTHSQSSISALEDRVVKKLRVRKHHFLDVKKHLSSAFYWSLDARQAFAQYMRQNGWTMVECPTETETAIASDYKSGEVVISRDSDMPVYESINTIWRPISRGLFLVYDVPDVLRTLNINRSQLTVPGVVSRNDYNRNIYSLGSATNFSIIKTLQEV